MWQGKAKTLRSSSLICLPNSAGMNDCLMASSKGCNKSAMLGAIVKGLLLSFNSQWTITILNEDNCPCAPPRGSAPPLFV